MLDHLGGVQLSTKSKFALLPGRFPFLYFRKGPGNEVYAFTLKVRLQILTNSRETFDVAYINFGAKQK